MLFTDDLAVHILELSKFTKSAEELATARAEALDQGRKEGRVGQIQICERLLRRAQTPAAQLLALPLAELDRLAQQLEAELTPSPS